LVNTIDELIKGYKNPLYPFVGSWTPRLSDLAGQDFLAIRDFKKLILHELSTEWMHLKHGDSASYYKRLVAFQQKYGRVLHIFSLNYDKCIEDQCYEVGINRGFKDHVWDWKNFIYDETTEAGIYLYKLHGSIDWSWTTDGFVEEVDNNVYGDDLAIIFGTSYKLQYLDLFLFLVYEFRRRPLENATKIILCIGYSFNDDHINGILGQSLKADSDRIIIAVYPLFSKKEVEVKDEIRDKLKLQKDANMHIIDQKAKKFFEETLSTETIEKYRGKDIVPF
jgi:2-hydroxy-3-keto-5-methylthiopentenyl-1-phosphate phosphatase